MTAVLETIGGQRAQLALTLAIARRPGLLILDEPAASPDPPADHRPHARTGGAAMIWLTWRQFGAQAWVTSAALAVLAAR